MSEDRLTADDIKKKIDQVIIDIEELRRTGDASRRLEVLSEYKVYLEDELRMLKHGKT
jgi:hypothetical protein